MVAVSQSTPHARYPLATTALKIQSRRPPDRKSWAPVTKVESRWTHVPNDELEDEDEGVVAGGGGGGDAFG